MQLEELLDFRDWLEEYTKLISSWPERLPDRNAHIPTLQDCHRRFNNASVPLLPLADKLQNIKV